MSELWRKYDPLLANNGCGSEHDGYITPAFLRLRLGSSGGSIDRPRRFNDAEHEKAWLIVCAQNHCRDVLKSAHRTRQTALPEDIADERRARQDETLDAVLALPEKYKTCVYLFYYEGYRTAEIAALTGVPSSTVRSHLSEARALLKTMLGGERHGR